MFCIVPLFNYIFVSTNQKRVLKQNQKITKTKSKNHEHFIKKQQLK
jgi:hypothetical protein